MIQEQQLARERNLETAGSDMQRRYHISDDAHPLQAGLDAAAGIADQVELISFLLGLPVMLISTHEFCHFLLHAVSGKSILFEEDEYDDEELDDYYDDGDEFDDEYDDYWDDTAEGDEQV